MNKKKKMIIGVLSGILNGLFGSGGGVVAVPLLESSGINAKKSHATSVAVIFFLSLVSVCAYALEKELDYTTALEYLPYGVLGAGVGSLLLKKIPNDLLRRIFGFAVTVAAVRILVK